MWLLALGLPALVLGPVSEVSADPLLGSWAPPKTWDPDAVRRITQQVQANQPTFPARDCNLLAQPYDQLVRQVVDGEGSPTTQLVWYYGDAINAAISDCHDAGGGTVVVPAEGSRNGTGVYYSGAIMLLSNVDLQVETGATIKFVRNASNSYYPLVLTSYGGTDFYNYSPLVYALNQTNIALTGGGTLDAQYNISPWNLSPGAATDPRVTLLAMSGAGLPVAQRLFTDDGQLPSQMPLLAACPPQQRSWGPCGGVQYAPPPPGTTAFRSTFPPQFVEFNHSTNILVQGITLVNTQYWNLHMLNSQNIAIKGLTISDSTHYTDDGIDLDSCRYVIVSGNDITTLDDGLAVKAGRNRDGRELRAPSEDIVVEGNRFTNPGRESGAAAIAVGSEMSGGVSNVFTQNNVAGGTGLGYLLRLKTNAYRGGSIEAIYVRNSTVTGSTRGVVFFDTSYGEVAPQPRTDVFNPMIRGVYLDNIRGTASLARFTPVSASGQARSPVTDVTYSNSLFYTASLLPTSFAPPNSTFFSNLAIRHVILVNPVTRRRVVYTSRRLLVANETVASTSTRSVQLRAGDDCRLCVVNHLPSQTFTLSGRIVSYRSLRPTVQVFLDRDPRPVAVRVRPDGSFRTGVIRLDNNQYWFRGLHYVSINLHHGIDVDTVVYDVAT